ncbi:late competence development ComFB family protein [Gammaproteobacteria bacterium AB-CW1]|uniref:Late competence development ComFB family protein n=1 Tax=Natronospira elongata TaxID=3110268 RepID=A0AAP6MNI8_9GAMM|nr:late competence development ComFB family protein [Gammaproteobacteria bacterium AB-CW1]
MFEIGNYYEQLVKDYLWKQMERRSDRPAQGYLEDVVCLALNRLPPRYVRHTVDLGSHLSDEEYAQMEQQVATAVDQAIAQVQARPRHRQ